MRIAGSSDVGMLRTENQDAYGIIPLKDGSSAICLVCDGLGGGMGGKEAAELCVACFRERFEGGEMPSEWELRDALSEANRRILSFSRAQEYTWMGTTLVLAAVTEEAVTVLWVGDSRAYHFREDSMLRLTRDHSYVEELVARDNLTEGEARFHSMRNLITRAVGTREEVVGDMCILPWREGDRLLLCSDGLHAMVEEKELCEILAEDHIPAHTVHVLISAANSHGGEDNITALVVENKKEISSNA